MPMSAEEVRFQLSSIEGDVQMYVDLGPDEVPLLVDLLDDEEPWLASRAVYALARIETPEARAAVEGASESERGELRVAAAVSASMLPTESSDRVLGRLVRDPDVAVRKFAVESVSADNEESIRRAVQELTNSDDEALRTKAQVRSRELGY